MQVLICIMLFSAESKISWKLTNYYNPAYARNFFSHMTEMTPAHHMYQYED